MKALLERKKEGGQELDDDQSPGPRRVRFETPASSEEFRTGTERPESIPSLSSSPSDEEEELFERLFAVASPEPRSAAANSKVATTGEVPDVGVCSGWSKGSAPCGDIEEFSKSVLACKCKNQRRHLCQFCGGGRKGKFCTEEDAKTAYKAA